MPQLSSSELPLDTRTCAARVINLGLEREHGESDTRGSSQRSEEGQRKENVLSALFIWLRLYECFKVPLSSSDLFNKNGLAERAEWLL